MRTILRIMKRIVCLYILLLLALSCLSQTTIPKHEVRAVWLTTIGGLDWPHSYAQTTTSANRQKAELCQILDKLKRANVNTILLQTRVRGTMIYPSAYEPWDGCLSGKPGISPGYDALQFAISECHKRGMEIHAWIVSIPLGKWNGTGCTKMRKKHPQLVLKIGDEGYMNPESIQTGDYLADICREIVRNYDVDGIHLDYIRYPETWKKKVNKYQGRTHITNIVRRISTTVKSEKPWVKMSCSPIGKYDDLTRFWSRGWNANTTVCQDAQGWLREGLMDELFPMMYFRDNNFFPFAIDWAECSYGRIVAPGLGIYMLHPHEQNWPLEVMKRELNVLRQYKMGHTYFRSKFFTDNVKGIYNYVSEHFDRYPALVPPMTWMKASTPPSPTHLQINKNHISWQHSDISKSSSYRQQTAPYPTLLYNIYASKHYPVDVNDARNLIVIRHQHNSIDIPGLAEQNMYVAITAMDRYGNESAPLQMRKAEMPFASSVLLKNNGQTAQIPEKRNILDADFIVIESITGEIIATKRYHGKSIDIRNIPNGVYIVRTLGRKDVTHRLGMMIIKR